MWSSPFTSPINYTFTADNRYVLHKSARESVVHMVYSHRPLTNDRSIRLIKRVGLNAEPVWFEHFEIQEFSLDDPGLSFNPISYVCGNSPAAMPVILGNGIDGDVCLVQETTWQALMSIAEPGYWVWIDQICVHHQDLDEKAKQIELMGEIYGSPGCRATVAWLAPPDEDIALAYDLLDMLKRTLPPIVSIPFTQNEALDLPQDEIHRGIQAKHPDYRPPSDDDHRWPSLARLFTKPWFTRMWCFQEVVLANPNQVVLRCSNPATVHTYSTTLSNLMSASILMGNQSFSERQKDAIMQGRDALSIIDYVQKCRHPDDPAPLTLHHLLQSTAGRSCKDPKEKVYALKRVQQNVLRMESITPNYTLSDVEVYADTTRKIIVSETSLLVSLSASSRFGGRVLNLPTWVPDYTGDLPATYLERTPPDPAVFCACVGRQWKPPVDQISPCSWSQLLVRGRKIDIISNITTWVMPADISSLDTFDYIRSELADVLPRTTARLDDNKIVGATSRIVRTVTCNGFLTRFYNQQQDSLTQEATQHNHVTARHEPQNEEEQDVRRFLHLVNSDVQMNKIFNDAADVAWMHKFLQQVKVWKGRRLAFLHRYGLSLVPEQTFEEDFVAILHGSTVPVVLRYARELGTYHLVGPCYVDGIMYGEAVDWEEDEADSFLLL